MYCTNLNKMNYDFDKGPDGEDLPFAEDIKEEIDELYYPNEEDRDAYYND